MLRKSICRRSYQRVMLVRCLVIAAVVCFVLVWRNKDWNQQVSDTVDAADKRDAVPDQQQQPDGNRGHPHQQRSPPPPPDSNVLDMPEAAGKVAVDSPKALAELDRQIAERAAKVVPGLGEGGAAVVLPPDEQKIATALMKKAAFNIVASDKITLNRTTPDNRNPSCHKVEYPRELPSASVIIIFTNEAWSPLLRTVHTVLNYSPAHLLHEIILLDDFSDKEELGKMLDRYLSKHLPSKVRIVRAPKRLGLIRARVEGAKAATGDVMVFLDSHCEATVGWLEPLLQRIKENRHAVLLPIIDVINDENMEFYRNPGTYFQVGGFTWSGHFTWIPISQKELQRRGSAISPTRSPTMAGGLFAVERKFFWEIGAYDEGMDVWGGENLEISFRIWMCGGLLETIPCSHVGHIFRSFHPYTFPGDKDTHGLNTARMVEVWMDDYKRLFYLYRNELETANIGDVTSRKELRKKLQCTPFKWFLDNIFPEKFILDENVYAHGRVTNGKVKNLCLDMLQRDEKHAYNMGLYGCHKVQTASQFMSLSNINEFRREDVCAESGIVRQPHLPAKVVMTNCHGRKGNQEWIHTKFGAIQHKQSGKCLDIYNSTMDGDVWLTECTGAPSQQWSFDVYLDL